MLHYYDVIKKKTDWSIFNILKRLSCYNIRPIEGNNDDKDDDDNDDDDDDEGEGEWKEEKEEVDRVGYMLW